MNSKNSKRALTSTIGLAAAVSSYFVYWNLYKKFRNIYPYNPYDLI